MLTILKSGAIDGIDGFLISVEVDISRGLPGLSIVGLPDNSIKESKDRVKTAISNSGHKFPQSKIIINLSPAGIKKEGPSFDLAIATAIIGSIYGFEQSNVEDLLILGELALNGDVKPIRGTLPLSITARKKKMKAIVVPRENADEAAAIDGVKVFAVDHLNDMLDLLKGENPAYYKKEKMVRKNIDLVDFEDVKGHDQAKRAIEIAASGGHNILMIGSPGSGKTMLAKRLPSILPELELEESIETTKIFSVSGLSRDIGLIVDRPFRNPHHTISGIALAGGGVPPRPGEISLAHNGILFLDELPEFQRQALEVLRQPLEDGKVTISRAVSTVNYPASFMLVASMNPCPCGYLFDSKRNCVCSENSIRRYQSKISGPLLDRIDISIVVNSVPFSELRANSSSTTSNEIRENVKKARKIQKSRFNGHPFFTNAKMEARDIEIFCKLDKTAEMLLKNAMDKLGISARGYSRILKVSRTISDLEGSSQITASHVSEALQYYNNTMFAR